MSKFCCIEMEVLKLWLKADFWTWSHRLYILLVNICLVSVVGLVSFWMGERIPLEFHGMQKATRGPVGGKIVTQRKFTVRKHGIKCKAVHFLDEKEVVTQRPTIGGTFTFLDSIDLPAADKGTYQITIPLLLPSSVKAGFYTYHATLFCKLNPLRTVEIIAPVLDIEVFKRNIVLPVPTNNERQ